MAMSAAAAVSFLAAPEPPHAARKAADPPAVATPEAWKKRRRETGSNANSSNSMEPPMPVLVDRCARGAAGSLPPNGGVHVRDLVDGQRVDARGEVLPAVVADHEHHVAFV